MREKVVVTLHGRYHRGDTETISGEILTHLLLLSRPREDSEQLANQLRHDFPALQIGIFPVLEIEKITMDLPSSDVDAVIFTSRHAVQNLGLPKGLPAFCTGPATAEKAKDAGFDVRHIAQTAKDLFAALEVSGLDNFLYLRGETARFDFKEHLQKIGKRAHSAITYRQVHSLWTNDQTATVQAAQVIIAPVFSPLTATLLGEKLETYRGPINLVAISQAAVEAWSGPAPNTITVAKSPDGGAMEQAIRSQLTRSRLEGPTIRD